MAVSKPFTAKGLCLRALKDQDSSLQQLEAAVDA